MNPVEEVLSLNHEAQFSRLIKKSWRRVGNKRWSRPGRNALRRRLHHSMVDWSVSRRELIQGFSDARLVILVEMNISLLLNEDLSKRGICFSGLVFQVRDLTHSFTDRDAFGLQLWGCCRYEGHATSGWASSESKKKGRV